MKPECAQTIKSAAGRELSKAELDSIEERVHGALRQLASKDIDAFRSMPLNERMTEAAKLAKEQMLKDVVAAHERSIMDAGRKAKLFSEMDTIKPGVKGAVHWLKNKVVGIENRVDAMSAEFFRRMEVADTGKVLGLFQDPAKVRDLNAALFGEAASPEAKAAAKTFQDANKALVDFYRAEGMPLHELDNWNLPQPQDPSLVAGAGREAWVNDHLNWVDPSKYVNPDGSMKSVDELRHFLGKVYDTLSTDGANKRAQQEGLGGGGMVGGNKNAPRQLFYKDSASYTEAMSKYGRSTNPYELITSHVRGMAKDLAFAETFGRDADANFRQALSRAEVMDKGAVAGSPKDVNDLNSLRNRTERIFDAMLHPDRPGNEFWANVGVQARGVMASSQLGSLVGALPDLAAMKMAAEFSGLPAMRMFRNFVDGIFSGAERKDFLHKMGVWMEGFQHASNRMAADEFKAGFGTWLNEVTHRAMGLNAFDRGMRAGVGRTVMDTIGSFTRRFGTLAEAEGEARLLQSKGVTEDHWQVWKAAEVDKGRGNETLLTPDAIHNVPDHVVDQIAEQRVARRSDILKGEIEKRNQRTAQEADWLQGRIDKFKERKQRAYDALQELRDKWQSRVEQKSDAVAARADLLKATIEKAQVEHDIAAHLKTETAQDRVQSFLDAVEDGATSEATGKRSSKAVARYGGQMDSLGQELGRRRAQVEAKIKEAQAKVDQFQQDMDARGDAKEKALAKKLEGISKEIADFAQELQDRAGKRKEYADAFQSKVGDVLVEERNALRTEAAVKLMEVTYGEMQFGARGASRSTIEDRMLMGTESGADAGTLAGELKRFIWQFKSVPLGIFRNHWNAGGQMDSFGAKWGYRAKFVAYSALMGAMAVELKAMINGQDPRNMNPQTEEGRKFWLESIAAGGGFGMYGDLFLNGQTSGGGGVETLMGPGVGAGWNIIKEARTAMEEANKGETKHPYALAGVRWVRKNATPLMNLWYMKAAFNRLVYDQMQDILAPGSSMKQQMRMQQRGVNYWWAPGTTAPQQAPDMSKAWQDH